MYSGDLVKTASTWATYRTPGQTATSSKKGGISLPNAMSPGGQGEGSTFTKSREWARISPAVRGLSFFPAM